MSMFNVKYSEISFIEVIGRGNFGAVWKDMYKGELVAVKQLYHLEDGKMYKYFAREMALLAYVPPLILLSSSSVTYILSSLKHPGCVELKGLCQDRSGIFIVTEFVAGGDLHRKLKKRDIPLSWLQRVDMALDLAHALQYMHAHNVIHRDLKSHNLLVMLSYLS